MYEEGKAAGLAEGQAAAKRAFRQTLLQCIEQKWQIPEELRQRIDQEEELETLQRWVALASKSGSLEDLKQQM